MSALPFAKPPKRGPKPRKPLPRPKARIPRTRRPRKRAKGPTAAMQRECDRIFSLIVRTLAGECARCTRYQGTPEMLQCAHIFKRKYLGNRWALMGAFGLCDACHRWLGDAPITGKPSRMRTFCIAKRGADMFELLRQGALERTPFKPYVLVNLLYIAHLNGVKVTARATEEKEIA